MLLKDMGVDEPRSNRLVLMEEDMITLRIKNLLDLGFGSDAGVTMAQRSLHEFKVDALEGAEIDFEEFRGRKVLIVNTASKCGFTPQYEGLQNLHETRSNDLVIIGFPCNNFLYQEAGDSQQIASFCQKNYGVSFTMAAKVSVRGKNQHPLFTWLCQQRNPDFTGAIRWNFEKFLLDEDGKLLRRFRSTVSPSDKRMIEALND